MMHNRTVVFVGDSQSAALHLDLAWAVEVRMRYYSSNGFTLLSFPSKYSVSPAWLISFLSTFFLLDPPGEHWAHSLPPDQFFGCSLLDLAFDELCCV